MLPQRPMGLEVRQRIALRWHKDTAARTAPSSLLRKHQRKIPSTRVKAQKPSIWRGAHSLPPFHSRQRAESLELAVHGLPSRRDDGPSRFLAARETSESQILLRKYYAVARPRALGKYSKQSTPMMIAVALLGDDGQPGIDVVLVAQGCIRFFARPKSVADRPPLTKNRNVAARRLPILRHGPGDPIEEAETQLSRLRGECLGSVSVSDKATSTKSRPPLYKPREVRQVEALTSLIFSAQEQWSKRGHQGHAIDGKELLLTHEPRAFQ